MDTIHTGQIYYIGVPLKMQAQFKMVAVFRESTQYVRNYTSPFNMITITTRSEGKDASYTVNLKTKERHEARVNQISLIPYNLPQQYSHTTRNEHLCIHFALEIFPGVDVFSGLDNVIYEYSEELTNWGRRIFEIEDPILMLSECQEFALHFCHRHWPQKYSLEIEPMRRFTDVLFYIQNDADATTTIQDLAEIAKMPLSTFCRSFHAALKMPPKKFLQNELYRKAIQMLLAPNQSVKTVASYLGFSSEFYFSHFFKRIAGISPKEYQIKYACGILESSGPNNRP